MAVSEGVPSRGEEQGLTCCTSQLGQPAVLYWAEWVHGGLTAWLEPNLRTCRGTALLCPLPALLPEAPPSQLLCFSLSREQIKKSYHGTRDALLSSLICALNQKSQVKIWTWHLPKINPRNKEVICVVGRGEKANYYVLTPL